MYLRDINNLMTQWVAKTIEKGYNINITSCQFIDNDSLFKVDLIKDRTLIRIAIIRFADELGDGVKLGCYKRIVNSNKYLVPQYGGKIVSTKDMTLVDERIYYAIGKTNSQNDLWFDDESHFFAAEIINAERNRDKEKEYRRVLYEFTSRKAKQVGLKWARRFPKRKTKKLYQVLSVRVDLVTNYNAVYSHIHPTFRTVVKEYNLCFVDGDVQTLYRVRIE